LGADVAAVLLHAEMALAGRGSEGAGRAHPAAAVGEADLHFAGDRLVGGDQLAALAGEAARARAGLRGRASLGAELRGADVQAVAVLAGRVAGRAVVAERAPHRRADAARGGRRLS